jgi:hypothetical protein
VSKRLGVKGDERAVSSSMRMRDADQGRSRVVELKGDQWPLKADVEAARSQR